MKKLSQKDKIRRHLLMGRKITGLQALKMYGCIRLASRISELSLNEGMSIWKKTIKTATGKHVAQYSMTLMGRLSAFKK